MDPNDRNRGGRTVLLSRKFLDVLAELRGNLSSKQFKSKYNVAKSTWYKWSCTKGEIRCESSIIAVICRRIFQHDRLCHDQIGLPEETVEVISKLIPIEDAAPADGVRVTEREKEFLVRLAASTMELDVREIKNRPKAILLGWARRFRMTANFLKHVERFIYALDQLKQEPSRPGRPPKKQLREFADRAVAEFTASTRLIVDQLDHWPEFGAQVTAVLNVQKTFADGYLPILDHTYLLRGAKSGSEDQLKPTETRRLVELTDKTRKQLARHADRIWQIRTDVHARAKAEILNS